MRLKAMGQKWGKPIANICHSMPTERFHRTVKSILQALLVGRLGLFSLNTPTQLAFGLVLVGNLVMGDSRFGRGCRLLNGNRSVINQWI